MKHFSRLVWTALIVAWVGDQLFWLKTPGLSILLIVVAAIVGGLYLARGEKVRPARASWPLLGMALVLFTFTVIRREPVTTLTNITLGLFLLMVFADKFREGGWVEFGFIQYIALFFRMILSALFEPIFFSQKRRIASQELPPTDQGTQPKTNFAPVLRGILLALPVVWLFATLLSSADLVFATKIENFFELFNFSKMIEYGYRSIYIVILAYVLSGVYLVALTRIPAQKPEELPMNTRILGFIEAVIVLGSVNLLFAAFVIIQSQYFYGGEANIVAEGYTYAEYARRGFGELITVAVGSLMLFFVLSNLAKREGGQKRIFSGLGVMLAVLIGVILVSAFQRLLLYEDAYGFTRLRTYPHVFMIWVGLLLVAFVGLEIAGKERYFAFATVMATLGFVLSLNLINVDGLIVRENLTTARGPRFFDRNYLLTLSTDATPALFEYFDDPTTPNWLHNELGFVLACQSAQVWDESAELSWPSYHFSRARAAILFLEHAEAMKEFPIFMVNGQYEVEVDHERTPCQTDWYGMD